jgi:hypothetical protein
MYSNQSNLKPLHKVHINTVANPNQFHFKQRAGSSEILNRRGTDLASFNAMRAPKTMAGSLVLGLGRGSYHCHRHHVGSGGPRILRVGTCKNVLFFLTTKT